MVHASMCFVGYAVAVRRNPAASSSDATVATRDEREPGGHSSDGDGGRDGWPDAKANPQQLSATRWWGADRHHGRTLRRDLKNAEKYDLWNLTSGHGITLALGWHDGDEWVRDMFYDSFNSSGERVPNIKDIQRLYVPGLMTANKQLRSHWGSHYTRYAWHGTSDIAAENIAVEGFDVTLCRKHEWGRCLRRTWFHEQAHFTATFAHSAKHRDWNAINQRPPRSFVMILALVSTPTETSPHTWIFRNDQAVPAFKVTYAYPKRRRR